ANAFSASSATTVGTSGALDLGGFDQTVASLSGTGTVTNSGGAAGALPAGGDNSSTTFSGAIADGTSATTALTKTGTGTLTLSGQNSFTGALSVNQGEVLVDGAVGGAANVAGGASLGGSGSIGGA